VEERGQRNEERGKRNVVCDFETLKNSDDLVFKFFYFEMDGYESLDVIGSGKPSYVSNLTHAVAYFTGLAFHVPYGFTMPCYVQPIRSTYIVSYGQCDMSTSTFLGLRSLSYTNMHLNQSQTVHF
jgi:hypothetical protein